jgi:hypothetical protein
MRARVALCGVIYSFLFSVYVNNMPLASHVVTFALYTDDTTIIDPSRKPVLLVSYLAAYLTDLERWLRERRFAISVTKNTAMIFVRAECVSSGPDQCSCSGSQFNMSTRHVIWGRPAADFVVSCRLGQKESCLECGSIGSSPEQEKCSLHQDRVLLYQQLIPPMKDYGCPAARTHLGKLQVSQSKRLRLVTGAL